jgi:hypothetical protein
VFLAGLVVFTMASLVAGFAGEAYLAAHAVNPSMRMPVRVTVPGESLGRGTGHMTGVAFDP